MNIDTTETTQTTETAIGYIPCYRLPFLSLFHADCMEIMKQYPDNHFDLAIVDPPYGIGVDGNKEQLWPDGTIKRKSHKIKGWDSAIPTSEYFKELFRVSKNQIIWGGNYFTEYLKPTKAWIIWYKGQQGLTMSDCEMAWTSFEKVTRMIDIHRTHLWQEKPIHPTQKPEKLYANVLNMYIEKGFKLLDTHFGSGSIALAVDKANKLDKMNLHLTACELDSDYVNASIKRISESIKQGTLSF